MSAKGSTVAMKAMDRGCPPFLGRPEGLWKLNGQYLGFRETVKLTRKGGTHQLKLVVYVEIALRQMDHMVVVEKNTRFQIVTTREGLGVGEPPKSHGTSEFTWQE